MAQTPFGKILSGEIPCYRLYEDAHVLAFLDIEPLSLGHTLVIPKEPAETLDALSDESSAAIGRALPRLCRALLKATGAEAYNVLQNNGEKAQQAVKHVHFHIIPRFDKTGLKVEWTSEPLAKDAGPVLVGRITRALLDA